MPRRIFYAAGRGRGRMTVLGVGLYVRGSVRAAALYKEAFGLEPGYHVLNADGSASMRS